jgi:polysaccharide export outer membrane protein
LVWFKEVATVMLGQSAWDCAQYQQEFAEMKRYLTIVAGVIFGVLSMLSPASAEGYGIQAGDVLKIEVLEDPSLNRSVLVDPTGRISVPQGGTLQAAGQSVESISATISKRLAANFAAAPSVFVSLERVADRVDAGAAAANTISIFVIGEAGKTGKLELEAGTTVLQMFAEMGGFSKFAATKRIQLRRTDAKTKAETVSTLNYPAIEAGTSTNGATTMQDGDVVIIPQRKLFE